MPRDAALARTAERLRRTALTYPETYEESPWGDRVVKVRGKIFLFCGTHEGKLYVSVKLPHSGRRVLAEPFAKPTPYGLGRSGWVTLTFETARAVDVERIGEWIAESYRAIAPKKLIARLEQPAPAATAPAQGKRKTSRNAKRVVLVCEDALRAERARRALAERGVPIDVLDGTDAVRTHVKKKKLDAVIIDVGRHQDAGIALAGEIDSSDAPILLFIVGIRDAAAFRRAQAAATSADLFRAPPGDPAVADAVASTLSRY